MAMHREESDHTIKVYLTTIPEFVYVLINGTVYDNCGHCATPWSSHYAHGLYPFVCVQPSIANRVYFEAAGLVDQCFIPQHSCPYRDELTTSAMTTGYIFHVENPVTVGYLQIIERSGHPSCDNLHLNLLRSIGEGLVLLVLINAVVIILWLEGGELLRRSSRLLS
ncbi:hypothetical protein ARMGADRAFT_1089743 [Armillaria gallica]|uniref:Uncharacterized protein n=1 Tax=Armillaria gallica TaxID=47427 RepID=A0A2H3D1V2_ARMGA|nr:hypothetical protein ARMGADRAFT_1089743 [Armillaria gallica]